MSDQDQREREQIDAERAVYEAILSPEGLSAIDVSVQNYDLTDHLELQMIGGSIVKITVEVTLP